MLTACDLDPYSNPIFPRAELKPLGESDRLSGLAKIEASLGFEPVGLVQCVSMLGLH